MSPSAGFAYLPPEITGRVVGDVHSRRFRDASASTPPGWFEDRLRGHRVKSGRLGGSGMRGQPSARCNHFSDKRTEKGWAWTPGGTWSKLAQVRSSTTPNLWGG